MNHKYEEALIQPLQFENENVYSRKEDNPVFTKEYIEYGYDPNEDLESDRPE